MTMKTAINLAMMFGAMVCGGIFVKLASEGNGFVGLLAGVFIGAVSGMMALGLLTIFLNKEDKALVRAQESQQSQGKVAPVSQEPATSSVSDKNVDVELVFSDGTKLTSQQLGYFSFGWSGQLADQIIDEIAPGKIAAEFPAASAINKYPFKAHLYLIMFHVAIYLSYLATVLRAPSQSISCFLYGLNDALGDVSSENGSPLSDSEREKLVKAVAGFAHAIDQDIESAATADNDVFNPNNAKATALLIEMLLNMYPSSVDSPPLSMYGIGQLLDDAPPSLMTILKNNLGLRLVSHDQP